MSAILSAAIKYQLENRVKRNAEGELLCRRCEKVVPPEYSIVFWNPEDEGHTWGPCCSDECICHLKICSDCNQDFIIDKEGDITHVGDGTWLCSTCILSVKLCSSCNKKTSLRRSPEGDICKNCYDKKYFLCSICGEEHEISDSIKNRLSNGEKVKWTHVVDIEKKVCIFCFDKAIKGKEPLPLSCCDNCGDSFSLTVDTLSDKYCPTCINKERVRACAHCREYVTRWCNLGGSYYCKPCEQLFTHCECCKINYIIKTSSIKHKGIKKTYKICKDCAKLENLIECKSCLSLSDRAVFLEGKKDTCVSCYNKYKLCDKCDEFHFNEDFCRNSSSSKYRVSDYSYKPALYFNFLKKTKVFFGFENEINYLEDNYDAAKRTLYKSYKASVIYAKRDGSISGKGFEVVSQPMTLEFFDSLDLVPMFQVSPKERDSSCGLHVHISRDSFEGPAHLYKFTEFINDNRSFIKKIAGRDFNSYSRGYEEKITKAVKGTAMRERYHAVNLTNPHTVEVRVFRGAKTEYQLRYRVEFVNALVEYTRDCSMMDVNDIKFFKKWLKLVPGYENLKKEVLPH